MKNMVVWSVPVEEWVRGVCVCVCCVERKWKEKKRRTKNVWQDKERKEIFWNWVVGSKWGRWGSRGPKHLTICFFFFFGIGLGHYTFAPVTRILFVCALLVVAIASKWEVFQIDVKNVFLKGNLSEKVYMQSPLSLFIKLNNVCHLQHVFYGLKQSSRAWAVKFISTISHLGYTASPYDFALFLCRTDKGTILLLLYVDYMIIWSLGPWNHSFHWKTLYYSSQVCF